MPDACIIPIQRQLDELSGQPGYIRQNTGVISALKSAANGANNIQTQLIANDGKDAIYRYTYIEPNCTEPNDCAETPYDICATGTSNPIQTQILTIDQCLNMPPIQLTMAQYRSLCNFTPDQFTTAQIRGRMDSIMRALSRTLLTDLCAAVGCFSTGVEEKVLNMINPISKVPNWGRDEEIKLDFEDAGIMSTPLLIGGRSVRYYQKGVNNGGVDLNGMNIGGMQLMPAWYDNQLQTVCPTEDGETLIALAPGIFHVVNYLENVGMFATDFKAGMDSGSIDPMAMFKQGETYAHGVIEDPVTGWMFDLDAIYDACDKLWKINISTKYDTILLPLQSCYDDCFTGVVKYDLCEIQPDVCETPTT